MMTDPGVPQATSTTLRAPPKALLIGRAGREPLARHVQQEGYFVHTADEADEGLERLRGARFDLVVLDVDAPGMGGARFIETLRADPALTDTPVIVTSAVDDVDAIERCLELGGDDYLPATFGPAILRARISAALDRRSVQDSQDLRREMNVARLIQRDFLPESLPIVPGVRLEALLHPARRVSGDFYDAFPLSSGNVVLVVGDVCDKGVGAALFMALFRSLIRASADPVSGGAIELIGGRRTLVMQSLKAATPADLLTRVAAFTNNYIARLHGRTNTFATVFMGVLNPEDGRLDYLNAGHEPALIVKRDGRITELRPTGPALGMLPDARFTTAEGKLEPGQSLLAFTDGLVEGRSPTGEGFGGERLRDVARKHSAGSAPELVQGIVTALKAFARQAEPHDDLTMLVAQRDSG
jgi:serine phosphatase RsbU (regulator of sigma subunit)